MQEIKFGTEGWRGVIAENFTFGNVKIVAQAIADYVNEAKKSDHQKKMMVGYDTRFLSKQFAETVAATLAANGMQVFLTDKPTPTPAVSFVVKKEKLSAGVMVTASHNPPRYNGIKFKADFGGSATSEIVEKIEEKLYKNSVKEGIFSDLLGSKTIQKRDITPDYLRFMRSYIDMKLLKRHKAKVLVDVMYGVSNGYMEDVLSPTRHKVTIMHNKIDPNFGGINPEPIEINLGELIRTTKSGRFDIGIAIDGDGDRGGAATPDGKILSSHKILALLLLHYIEDRRWTGSVVKTISGSTLINKICRKYNLKMHETPVGFKKVCEIMLKENVLIGGEESGGIGFKGYIPERDGMLSGLLLLEMMAHRNKGILEILKNIEKEYGSFEYARQDLKFPLDKKDRLVSRLKSKPLKTILNRQVIELKTYDGIKHICDDESWLLFRFSGTEPILRVYAEAPSLRRARNMVEFGKELAFSIK